MSVVGWLVGDELASPAQCLTQRAESSGKVCNSLIRRGGGGRLVGEEDSVRVRFLSALS